MSRTWNALTGGRRLLVLALLAAAPAAARAQQPKPEELAAQAKAVLTKSCFECHGKDPARIKKKLNVLDHAALVDPKRKLIVPKSPDASLLIQRVEDNDLPMPPEPRPKVSEADRKVLRAWVAAGAPDFSKGAGQTAAAPAPAPPAPAKPKPEELAAQAKAILTNRCFECHGKDPAKIKKKLKILDHAALLADKRKLVVPGAPGDSLIVKRIESAESPMPPEDQPPVPEAERKVLRAWIAAGAPAFVEKTAAAPVTPPPPAPATTTPAEVKPPAPKTEKTEAKVDAARPAGLDAALLEQAPQLLAYLREKGYKNVGVLKFRAMHEGEEEASDNFGPLNQTLATRLELALALADNDKDPVGIIRGASDVAALVPKANHRTAEGRPLFFAPNYPLVWGDARVKPDAFLTGGVLLSADLRRMMIWLYAFGKDGKDVDQLGKPFIVACDPGLAVEAGESFLVRGAFKEPDALTPAKALEAAAALRDQQVVSPLLDRDAPVRLEVRYDGKPVPVEFQDGRFRMLEPKEGQKVSFVIRRVQGVNERLGIVLKVNGSNSLFRERLPDAQCRKWVLEPGADSLTVDRFQTEDKDSAGPLEVQAVPKSEKGAIRYGPDVGTVSLVVFREARGKAEAPAEAALDQAAVARGGYPRDQAADLAALKQQLHKDAAPENAAHALAAPAQADADPKEAEFRAEPTPVMALTIACYRR
jgi:mono/diheme cytochrome c family protein